MEVNNYDDKEVEKYVTSRQTDTTERQTSMQKCGSHWLRVYTVDKCCNGPHWFILVQPTPRVSFIPILKHTMVMMTLAQHARCDQGLRRDETCEQSFQNRNSSTKPAHDSEMCF